MNEKRANNDRVRYRELKEGQGEGGKKIEIMGYFLLISEGPNGTRDQQYQ